MNISGPVRKGANGSYYHRYGQHDFPIDDWETKTYQQRGPLHVAVLQSKQTSTWWRVAWEDRTLAHSDEEITETHFDEEITKAESKADWGSWLEGVEGTGDWTRDPPTRALFRSSGSGGSADPGGPSGSAGPLGRASSRPSGSGESADPDGSTGASGRTARISGRLRSLLRARQRSAETGQAAPRNGGTGRSGTERSGVFRDGGNLLVSRNRAPANSVMYMGQVVALESLQAALRQGYPVQPQTSQQSHDEEAERPDEPMVDVAEQPDEPMGEVADGANDPQLELFDDAVVVEMPARSDQGEDDVP